ncbi:hypothetical protein H920_06932 [Fukomys damarensis]|uniref:Uncharacterized protein n=1 Tax=Fukomys damarensis TaxID=885580 RepID=A0A091DMS3_FUKDA|nr:hypothetical protein H920_06932 [Fukomys damarensis]
MPQSVGCVTRWLLMNLSQSPPLEVQQDTGLKLSTSYHWLETIVDAQDWEEAEEEEDRSLYQWMGQIGQSLGLVHGIQPVHGHDWEAMSICLYCSLREFTAFCRTSHILLLSSSTPLCILNVYGEKEFSVEKPLNSTSYSDQLLDGRRYLMLLV